MTMKGESSHTRLASHMYANSKTPNFMKHKKSEEKSSYIAKTIENA